MRWVEGVRVGKTAKKKKKSWCERKINGKIINITIISKSIIHHKDVPSTLQGHGQDIKK